MKKTSTARATTRSGKKKAAPSKRAPRRQLPTMKKKPEATSANLAEVERAEAIVRETDLRGLSPRARFRWALRELKRDPMNYNAALVRAVFICVGFDPTRVDTLIMSVLSNNARRARERGVKYEH
jgi:hypothetical protein